jgi:hypothetical protein
MARAARFRVVKAVARYMQFVAEADSRIDAEAGESMAQDAAAAGPSEAPRVRVRRGRTEQEVRAEAEVVLDLAAAAHDINEATRTMARGDQRSNAFAALVWQGSWPRRVLRLLLEERMRLHRKGEAQSVSRQTLHGLLDAAEAPREGALSGSGVYYSMQLVAEMVMTELATGPEEPIREGRDLPVRSGAWETARPLLRGGTPQGSDSASGLSDSSQGSSASRDGWASEEEARREVTHPHEFPLGGSYSAGSAAKRT